MRVQFVNAKPNGDVTVADASSYGLGEYGWDLNGQNIPASYLTGYLAGKKALANGIDEAILDLGLQSNTNGSRIYAALKGVIDAGVEVPSSEDILPEEETVKGEHIKNAAESYEDDEFKQVFATYAEKKVNAADLPDLVDKVVSTIDGKF
jgi:large subunit ribosomal protein L18